MCNKRGTIAVLVATLVLLWYSSAALAVNQITVLYDAFGKPSYLKKDWGFSALVEVNGKRILFDTGNNAGIFAHNVKAKGVDLAGLDFAVISHRHGDHIGGLSHLLTLNPDVKIYAPEEGFGVFGFTLPGTFYQQNESLPPEQRYFDGDPPELLRFGTAWPQGNFDLIGEPTEVAPGFHVLALPGAWGADPPVLELSLAIDTPAGIVLVVGCSHPTIERIVEAAKAAIDKPIHLVIGGTHLLPASEEEIKRIATALHDNWRVKWIAPAHCTGEPAFEILKKTFGARYIYAGLNTTLPLRTNLFADGENHRSYAFFDTADLRRYRMLSVAEPEQHDHGSVIQHSWSFKVTSHRQVPANDGGLSLGQAAIGAARVLNADRLAFSGTTQQRHDQVREQP